MKFSDAAQNRKRLRLKNYDYSADGAYFITICTTNREHFFGAIRNHEMRLNECGEIVLSCWSDLPNHYSNCRLDKSVVMPNHFHGIIWIDNETNRVGTGFKPVPTPEPVPTGAKIHGLSEIVRGLKTFSSRRINDRFQYLNLPCQFRWQRSFHDHIIRSNAELNHVRDYIFLNPKNWKNDLNN